MRVVGQTVKSMLDFLTGANTFLANANGEIMETPTRATCATCAHYIDHGYDGSSGCHSVPNGPDAMRDGYCLMDGSCVWEDGRCWCYSRELPEPADEDGLDALTEIGEFYG